ncbi:MAG: hypothetical protein LBT81_05595 [Helicobacteraceae bacterium]|nr:hypothetical protein [Helicobacteraceae bacterium]
MFGSLRLPQKEFDRFISGVRIDPRIRAVFALCREKQIPICIASAGFDCCIKRLIGDLIVEFRVTLLSGRGKYAQKTD